jgi:hypothetical protein
LNERRNTKALKKIVLTKYQYVDGASLSGWVGQEVLNILDDRDRGRSLHQDVVARLQALRDLGYGREVDAELELWDLDPNNFYAATTQLSIAPVVAVTRSTPPPRMSFLVNPVVVTLPDGDNWVR